MTQFFLGFGPLFPVPQHPLFIGPKGLLGCVLVGLLIGGLSALLTLSVYAAQDAFQQLLQGSVRTHVILGVLVVKWFIWAVSLGCGRSGGVLAPLLMMGGALGV